MVVHVRIAVEQDGKKMILLDVLAATGAASRLPRRNVREHSSSALRRVHVVVLTLMIMLVAITESIAVKWSHVPNLMKVYAKSSATPQRAKRLNMTVHSVERNVVGLKMRWTRNMARSSTTIRINENSSGFLRYRKRNDYL